jgi:hypothetical protein
VNKQFIKWKETGMVCCLCAEWVPAVMQRQHCCSMLPVCNLVAAALLGRSMAAKAVLCLQKAYVAAAHSGCCSAEHATANAQS